MVNLISLIIIICGIVNIIDGILSLIVVQDKRFFWQLGRVIRICIGIILIINGILLGVV